MRKLYAVLVGINKYYPRKFRLKGCLNDVDAMKAMLETYVDAEEVTLCPKVLKDEEATRENIIAAFDHFKPANAGDICVFFFSGHGSIVDAPKEFWHEEPDQKLRTVVCYDSRLEGGKDLLNKEIAYLIWKSLGDKKGVHFTTIMDCCFAMGNTRYFSVETSGAYVKERMYEKNHTPNSLEGVLGFEDLIDFGNGNLSAPVGRHISLSACKTNQTSKELGHQGSVFGVFTYCLVQALANRNKISYHALMSEVNLKVLNFFDSQSPKVFFTHQEDVNQLFLGGIANERKDYFLRFDKRLGWRINAGIIDGITLGNGKEQTKFRIEESNQMITLSSVSLAESTFKEDIALDAKKVYKAQLVQRATDRLVIGFHPHFPEELKATYLANWKESKSDNFTVIDSWDQANYLLYANEEKVGLTLKGDQRFLTSVVNDGRKDLTGDLIHRMDTIAKWEYVRQMQGPDPNDPALSYQVDIERTTTPADYSERSTAKQVDPLQTVELPYLSTDGRIWDWPAFRFKVTNTSKGPLNFSMLYLDDRYAIHPVLQSREIGPGEYLHLEVPVDKIPRKTVRVQMEKEYHQIGITSIMSHLVLITSTSEFGVNHLKQGPIPREGYQSPLRGSGRFKNVVPEIWRTEVFTLNIKRPLPLIRQGESYFGISIQTILPLSSVTMHLLSFEDAMAQVEKKLQMLHPNKSLQYSIENTELTVFDPYEMMPGAKADPGLSVVSIYVQEEGSEAELLPIEIHFARAPQQKPTPYTFDLEALTMRIIKHEWLDENRLALYELPKAFASYYEVLGKGMHVFLGRG